MKKFIATLLILMFAMGIAGSALATTHTGSVPGAKGPLTGIENVDDLVAKIQQVVDIIFVILIVAAVIFIIVAAFQFVMAGGKSESISEARQKVIWAVVGIVLALFARAIPGVIDAVLRGS